MSTARFTIVADCVIAVGCVLMAAFGYPVMLAFAVFAVVSAHRLLKSGGWDS